MTKIEEIKKFSTDASIILASSNELGLPHVTHLEKIKDFGLDEFKISFWFCPVTISNISENPLVSVCIWKKEAGFQILGSVTDMNETAILNGFDSNKYIPTVLRTLTIKIEKITEFSMGPHNDEGL